MPDKPMKLHVLFNGEFLTPAEAQERLEAAQEVSRGLQARIALANSIIESYKDTVADRDRVLMAMQRAMRAWAQRLARAGEYDHKGKNEVLLRVVADLLATAERNFSADFSDNDDIPF